MLKFYFILNRLVICCSLFLESNHWGPFSSNRGLTFEWDFRFVQIIPLCLWLSNGEKYVYSWPLQRAHNSACVNPRWTRFQTQKRKKSLRKGKYTFGGVLASGNCLCEWRVFRKSGKKCTPGKLLLFSLVLNLQRAILHCSVFKEHNFICHCDCRCPSAWRC